MPPLDLIVGVPVAVWSLLNVVIIAVTAVVIWRQLRLQRYAHTTQAMFLFGTRWRSIEMATARREVCENYAPGRAEMKRPQDCVARFFEDLATFTNRRALPVGIVWSIWAYDLEHYWSILDAAVCQLRKETGDPSLFTEFQRLSRKMRRRGRLKSWRLRPLPLDVNRFIDEETQRIDYYTSIRRDTLIVGH